MAREDDATSRLIGDVRALEERARATSNVIERARLLAESIDVADEIARRFRDFARQSLRSQSKGGQTGVAFQLDGCRPVASLGRSQAGGDPGNWLLTLADGLVVSIAPQQASADAAVEAASAFLIDRLVGDWAREALGPVDSRLWTDEIEDLIARRAWED
ncbi:hypothetical protein [Patulibacter defluvii]|uniref:hypothetical protein n=1 Tax=Patulibacter defluvii TaxID=3095358 RepID=UPI002A75DB55|nr:hypothetical protein [Patulibacter sp. DM4]